MKRYTCIHCHCYQPPRENPWLEEVEMQDSAYPYHDWNQRVTAECYAPNTASRILNHDRRIIDIINNYSKVSFNFGPTLLSWMLRHKPHVYHAIIQADIESQKKYSGHGNAIAQVYNHMIMPLANSRDKRTQVIWGIADFEYRFKRKPEGMWLAETAVDLETLELMSEHGIKFTILAPGQAKQVKQIGSSDWVSVEGARIDPKRAYLCQLPSGRNINIFFYDGPISHNIAFGELLKNGEDFAKRLLGAFYYGGEPQQLVSIATDGETFGHHHKYGEMALSYCLYFLEENKFAQVTNYAEFLKMYPPAYEVEIIENSAWSCAHGVGRWSSDCGCSSGAHSNWNQRFREPLRQAMDWLRDNLSRDFEEQARVFFPDVWQARNDYIEVILNRKQLAHYFEKHGLTNLAIADKTKLAKLLEIQRHAMLMFTSCGWFFDEVSGIETVQIMMYAARAMQLAREVYNKDYEPEYLERLEKAPSNIEEFGSGRVVYEKFVKPHVLDLFRVGAHYAVSSLFEHHSNISNIYCYSAQNLLSSQLESGRQKLLMGKAIIRSEITFEEETVCYCVLHFGDHNLMGGIVAAMDDNSYVKLQKTLSQVFDEGDMQKLMALMDQNFGGHSFSFWHLFKDEQRYILNQIVKSTYGEIETSFQQIYEKHYPVMRAMRQFGIPLPQALIATLEIVFSSGLRQQLENDNIDLVRLQRMVDSIIYWGIRINCQEFSYFGTESLNRIMTRFGYQKENVLLIESIETVLKILCQLEIPLNLWQAQNIYFEVSKSIYHEMKKKSQSNDQAAKKWVKQFEGLGQLLQVTVA